jgi:VPS62-like protein
MTSHPTLRSLAALLLLFVLCPVAARGVDRDHDGLDDDVEDALLQRYAPVVLLAPEEHALPASTDWLLARAEVETAPGRAPPRMMEASILGAVGALVARAVPGIDEPGARLRLPRRAHTGSADPSVWTVYGHAFRADGGGIVLQYWFFYAFNDAFWAFDHEGDWEHVSLRLDAAGHPLGAWYAQHTAAAPGEWLPWGMLAHDGDRPVVLAGRGTHASYSHPGQGPIWERLCPVSDPARAAAAGCRVWHTSEGGGVVNVGERAAPRVPFLTWPGRWGTTGWFGLARHAGSPPGPAFQRGWCSDGAPGACP